MSEETSKNGKKLSGIRPLEPRGMGSPEEVGQGNGCLGLFLGLAFIPVSLFAFGLYCVIA